MSDSEIWRIVDIPPVVSSTEGKDVTITAKIAGPSEGPQPTATWIKGKFSELKKSARLALGINEEKQEAFLTIKKAKIFDEGKYTLKLKTGDQEVQTTIQVNVGKQEVSKPATEAAGDADSFKKRMRRYMKSANKAIAGDQGDVWMELTKASPKDYAEIAFNHGITDLRGMLKRLAAVKKKKKDGEKDDKASIFL
ncbi:Oidioi.mRNA.OKI2018_I69.PAR.g10194.t1.cds [Oikopleura dioica]|uniref:Oidioi.mRNA.OKI2018_I69.PAR.g10194.t1.cds n=1 Tax=Oikopleura dioica TaxID=34765 RepID=A0ABN7RSE5_OIKDI|nr:Oidioi.mRNA.OKI2018_I69.PAR.g10194.t1.cds [Oikopleura dioica]